MSRRPFGGLTRASQAADNGGRACYLPSLASGLDFRILGPLEVRNGGRAIHLGGTKQRSVLAILLLHAGTVVSVDRLIDELWAESPPADAQTALHQHVSRLRKLLQPYAVIVTHSGGYALELGGGELDLRRFEGLRDEGRVLLDDGRPLEASERLREALALWRGRPLADLEHEHFAHEAVLRLDEEWIETLEARVEADLALGRHAELVGELRPLVHRHPLRERLRGQLMVALYRSGRQAEALDVYADARRTFAAELGLEPGPQLKRLHQAVLNQDPELDLERPPSALPRRRTPRVVLAAAVIVCLVALGVGFVLAAGEGGDNTSGRPATVEGVLAAVDVATGKVTQRIPAGRTPASVAATDGTLWVVDADARTLLRVEASSGEVETLATGATPTDVAVGTGAVWVTNGTPTDTTQVIGPLATHVVQLDPATRTQRASIELPAANGAVSPGADNRLAASSHAVWAVTPAGSIVRIDRRTAAITASVHDVNAVAVAAGAAGVWALGSDGSAMAFDERTARVRLRVRLPTDAPTALAVGDTAAWATSSADGILWRLGPDGQVGALAVGAGVTDVAASGNSVWVVNPTAGTLSKIDAISMRVVHSTGVGGVPRSLAIDGGTIWVALTGETASATPEATGVQPVSASICEPVLAGEGGSADLLVVSDLPLQGGIHISTTQMTQAVTFVLREHGFRAGDFRIAYQSCDDSVARTGLFDEAKCAANARTYASNPDVVAVIGTLNSPCAVAALPELNRARSGPLPMISPLNSLPGLTRDAPGVAASLLASLYPTGRRNYLRVYPPDDLQGAALALLARDRGRDRVFVLDDGQPEYGVLMATWFETAARRLGLEVVGRATWDPKEGSYTELAERVAASRAQAVFVGGLLDTNAARVVRDLRARVHPTVDLLAPDGLTPLPLLARAAGTAAQGVFVSLPGLVPEKVPAAGADFVRRFAHTQAGLPVEPSAVYTAQATGVLLDAIARSDGTRESVLDELFRTRLRDGLLGEIAFDNRGDIIESPVTILRVALGRSSTESRSVEGGVVDRIVRPAASLVATRG